MLAAAVLFLLASPAFAQDRTREARTLFETAMEHLHAGDFTAARDLLNQSIALAPNPAAGFNLGLAYRGSGEVLRAAAVFEDVLKGTYGSIPRDKRAEVKAMLEAARKDIAHVVVTVSGAPRSEVRVDGRVVEPAAAESQSVDVTVDPGDHVVTASATDYETSEARVRVERGGTAPVSLKLAPLLEATTGTLVIEASNDDDVIIVAGVARARGHLERTVAPGTYVVELDSKNGKRDAKVVVKPRSTVRYRFDAIDDSTLWESPYFWGAVGVGVAAIAVTTILIIGPPKEDPTKDPVFGSTAALW